MLFKEDSELDLNFTQTCLSENLRSSLFAWTCQSEKLGSS